MAKQERFNTNDFNSRAEEFLQSVVQAEDLELKDIEKESIINKMKEVIAHTEIALDFIAN